MVETLQHNTIGIFLNIFNLYSQVKYCVKIGIGRSSQTSFLVCKVGDIQGENLSPFLFSIFLNDMSEFISHAYQGLDLLKYCTSQMLSDDDIELSMS